MKNKIILYVCIAIFGILGIYLTFIASNISKFDSETKAYRIDVNEQYDSDGSTYNPIYYFKVNGIDYECKTITGSSSYHNEAKKTVYYDSTNPTNCKTEYDKSQGKLAGIICLVVTLIIVYFFIIKKPSSNIDETSNINDVSPEKQQEIEEKAQKVINVIGKVQLIYKRVILGIVIIILLVLILIDTAIVKQTIKARNYIDTIATYVDKKEESDSSIFDDYTYIFEDKDGKTHEIVISISPSESPKEKVPIKYDDNNPQEFYQEGEIMDKSEIIWYIVKIVACILLILLFFNKKLLNKIGISFS